MRRKVIAGLSFGLRINNKPGLSNRDLAAVMDILQIDTGLPSLVQWEIARCVLQPPVFEVKKHRVEGRYLDSEEVVDQMVSFLRQNMPDVDTIVLVAHPFLHRYKCKKLFKFFGYKVETAKTGWVRFDKKSIQWYTQNPIYSFIYAVLQIPQVFFGRGSKNV